MGAVDAASSSASPHILLTCIRWFVPVAKNIQMALDS